MTNSDPAYFHRIYGSKKPRAVYYKRDFIDYVLMLSACGVVIRISYGPANVLSVGGIVLCVTTLAMFVHRHGIELSFPVLLRRPQDLLFVFLYKIRNLRGPYFAGLALLVAENALIGATPGLPHYSALMRSLALYLFYGHFAAITAMRTVILVEHLRKRNLVHEILMQTPWQRVVRHSSIKLEIIHAYCTGLLTHIVLLGPWYLVLTHVHFSLVLLPLMCAANVYVYWRWLRTINSWFYRDHWLGHNSELDFVYLHGPHHDAIPCGLIGGAENGFLEGFLRFTLGSPSPFFNPLFSFLVYTLEMKQNIEAHQYIPGLYPKLSKELMEISQHSTHHYGPIEPYGFCIKVDQPGGKYKDWFRQLPDELRNSAKLDEELTDFVWDNPIHRLTLRLYERYQR